jgi:hypothetical protein
MPASTFTLNSSESELARRVLKEYIVSDFVVRVDAASVGFGVAVACSTACWKTASAFERMGIWDKDDGECWATIRLRDSEVTTTLIGLSLSSAATSGPRRLVGVVDRSDRGVPTIATEISLKEVMEIAEEIGVTKGVVEKFTTGPTAAVGSGFSVNVIAGTGKSEQLLTIQLSTMESIATIVTAGVVAT